VTNEPLPPGARIGEYEVRTHPIACFRCGARHEALDWEEWSDDGLRLICRGCGTDILSAVKRGSDASAY